MKEKHSDKGKDQGFRLPEDYFKTFESRAGHAARFKDAMPQNPGFGIPENYFEHFEERLHQNRIGKHSPALRGKGYSKRYYYAAAAIGVFLISTLIGKQDPGYGFSQVETADVQWLLDTGVLDISESYLMENSRATDLADISITDDLLDPNSLEEYILDELDIYGLTE